METLLLKVKVLPEGEEGGPPEGEEGPAVGPDGEVLAEGRRSSIGPDGEYHLAKAVLLLDRMENPYHLAKVVLLRPDGEPLGPGEGGPPLGQMENLYHLEKVVLVTLDLVDLAVPVSVDLMDHRLNKKKLQRGFETALADGLSPEQAMAAQKLLVYLHLLEVLDLAVLEILDLVDLVDLEILDLVDLAVLEILDLVDLEIWTWWSWRFWTWWTWRFWTWWSVILAVLEILDLVDLAVRVTHSAVLGI